MKKTPLIKKITQTKTNLIPTFMTSIIIKVSIKLVIKDNVDT